MDGIDWMMVAEVMPADGIVVALALGGAVLGFAYFYRATAKPFFR
jgi:hypothetical protein